MENLSIFISDLGALDPTVLAMALVALALYVLLEAIKKIK
jgi:hypothetical protein